MINKISYALFFTVALMLVGCTSYPEGPDGWTAEPPTRCPCIQGITTNCPCPMGKMEKCPCGMQKITNRGMPLLSAMISGATQDLMDQSDEKLAREAAIRALENSPVGVSQYWLNPNTDKHGESKVISVGDNGRCRVLFSNVLDQTDMEIGSERVMYCKSGDMSWSTK